MGYELRRMIRDGAPPKWSSSMRLVACEIADTADPEPSKRPPDFDGPAESQWSIADWQDHDGQWHDGLATRCGLTPRTFSYTLTRLSRAGYEMRKQLGTGSNGKPVYAVQGKRERFVVPLLKPRSRSQDVAASGRNESSPRSQDVAAESPENPSEAPHSYGEGRKRAELEGNPAAASQDHSPNGNEQRAAAQAAAGRASRSTP
jgi:hypothetical protein